MISSRTRTKRHITDVLFTLTLFCVFAAASLIVVFIGAEVYSAAINRADTGFEINTTLSFVSTKIRQHDNMGSVRIDSLEGADALVLEQHIGDMVFETWIYHHEGALREIVINRDNTQMLWLGAGQQLVDVYSFEFEKIHDGLIEMRAASANGIYGRALMALRSGRGM